MSLHPYFRGQQRTRQPGKYVVAVASRYLGRSRPKPSGRRRLLWPGKSRTSCASLT